MTKEEINVQDGLGKTRLHLACQNDNVERVRNLIKMGAVIDIYDDHGFTPMHEAIRYANLKVLKFLVESGADINYKDPRYGGGYEHHAIQESNLEVIDLLGELGAPVDEKDKEGWTPIWFAIGTQDPLIVQWFLNKVVSPLSKNPSGYTLLEATEDSPEINEVLKQAAK